MAALVDYPAVLFIVLIVILIAAVICGEAVSKRFAELPDDEREDFKVVQTATLTLLALIIGFSLSMAVGRYDQRKNLEEAEANANAVGTQYARADLADPAVGAAMKKALVRYLHLRLDDYRTRDPGELARIGRDTAAVESELWRLATQVARDQPTPIGATVVTGMNDVLNSQDYAEAARINRIPVGAWSLMFVIAMLGCGVQGYGARGRLRRSLLLVILPATVSLSLALIADIDSPRGGLIHVQPQDLSRLLRALER